MIYNNDQVMSAFKLYLILSTSGYARKDELRVYIADDTVRAIVEQFAKEQYESYLLIDFARTSKNVTELFDYYLDDIDTLLSRLEMYGQKRLMRRPNKGAEARSLIIFDEVQF